MYVVVILLGPVNELLEQMESFTFYQWGKRWSHYLCLSIFLFHPSSKTFRTAYIDPLSILTTLLSTSQGFWLSQSCPKNFMAEWRFELGLTDPRFTTPPWFPSCGDGIHIKSEIKASSVLVGRMPMSSSQDPKIPPSGNFRGFLTMYHCSWMWQLCG